MINSTKRGQYWSFWWHIRSNHQNQEVSLVNRVVEVVAEASEAAEADEVNETARVFNKVIQVLEFSFILIFGTKKIVGRIMKNHVEY